MLEERKTVRNFNRLNIVLYILFDNESIQKKKFLNLYSEYELSTFQFTEDKIVQLKFIYWMKIKNFIKIFRRKISILNSYLNDLKLGANHTILLIFSIFFKSILINDCLKDQNVSVSRCFFLQFGWNCFKF